VSCNRRVEAKDTACCPVPPLPGIRPAPSPGSAPGVLRRSAPLARRAAGGGQAAEERRGRDRETRTRGGGLLKAAAAEERRPAEGSDPGIPSTSNGKLAFFTPETPVVWVSRAGDELLPAAVNPLFGSHDVGGVMVMQAPPSHKPLSADAVSFPRRLQSFQRGCNEGPKTIAMKARSWSSAPPSPWSHMVLISMSGKHLPHNF
jgi:hypothetical protein